MKKDSYLKLGDLKVYEMALTLSEVAWQIYQGLHQQDKYLFGSQFIRCIDSIGANIAEGYGRYHYKDRAKFYYNARGSLVEAKHWTFLMYKRKKIVINTLNNLLQKLEETHKTLNSYINSCYKNI